MNFIKFYLLFITKIQISKNNNVNIKYYMKILFSLNLLSYKDDRYFI